MPKSQFTQTKLVASREEIAQLSRRKFLGFAGAATGLIAVASSCNKNESSNITLDGVDLGSGDGGILNYAYALEQLEAAFYTQVIMSMTPSMFSSNEVALITDIRDHEIAHREFFKNALGGDAIIDLEVDFSSIDFGSRDSVLGTAKAFEDLGVSAYNGAGRLIQTEAYLIIAGQIVSVEARHAAYIRDVIENGTFADDTVIDAMGLDGARKPVEVLAIAQKYIKTKINASNLPTY